MIDILGKPWFLQFIVPLLTVFLSVFLKFVTRNDQHRAFKWDDFAIGLNVSVTALMIFITDTVATAGQVLKASGTTATPHPMEKLMWAPWIILTLVVLIWIFSTLVRKMGWKEQDQLTPLCGIIVPNVFGLIALLFVVNWIA